MSTRPTATVTHFHTFHPDAQAELDALATEDKQLALAEAREGDSSKRRMSSKTGRRDEIAARLDELRAIIASGAVRITFTGLPRREYRILLTEHQPRDDNPIDKDLGYNADTFGDALIKATITATTDLDGNPVPNEWDTWADEMTDGQWYDAFRATLRLQTSGNPVYPRLRDGLPTLPKTGRRPAPRAISALPSPNGMNSTTTSGRGHSSPTPSQTQTSAACVADPPMCVRTMTPRTRGWSRRHVATRPGPSPSLWSPARATSIPTPSISPPGSTRPAASLPAPRRRSDG